MHFFQLRRGFAVKMAYIEMTANGRAHVAGSDSHAAHTNGDAQSTIRSNPLFKQGRIDAVLQRYQKPAISKVRHDGVKRVRRVVGTDSNKADIELALDLIGKNNRDPYVERTVRHVNLQSL